MSYSVSVIIPTYNRSALVKQCVSSLLACGLPDIEVVVADDGSTDDTEAVVRAFGEPVRYVRQQNAGPAAARNRGAGISQGRYLTFLDSDDAWRPGVAQRLVDQLDRHPSVAIAFSDTLMGNAAAGYVSFIQEYGGEWFWSLPGDDLEPGFRQMERWAFLEKESRRNVMFLGSLLVRREAFERVGAFDGALRGAADWEFFMRAIVGLDVAFSAGEAVALYEKHDEGMSTDSTHMETDFGLALGAVLKKCELPKEMRRHLAQRYRDQWFGFAYQAFDRGDYELAQQRLQRAAAGGPTGLREWMWSAMLSLPPGIVRSLRGLWRMG